VNFLNRVFGRKATELTYDQIIAVLDKHGGAAYTEAGIFVSPKTALQVSTVLACARAIADGCATPDLGVFREKKDKTREKATNIPEYRILARRPNEWQTSFQWRRMMTLHAVLAGTGLSYKVRGENRRIRELIPVPPGNWQERQVSRYEVVYDCYDTFGKINTFAAEDVFLVRNLQWQMMETMNCVQIAGNSIKIAMESDRNLRQQQANGLKPAGVYSITGSLNDEQHTKLEKWINSKVGNGKPLVLDRDAKWQQLSQNNTEGQTAELRAQTIEEVCRVMGVFPIIVGHSDKAATFASTESFFGAHLKNCLMPWHKEWTQGIDEFLLDGSGPLYAQFDTRYLTAGSMKDRGVWARSMTEAGIYTRNEIRDEDGLDPLPGLDEPLTPLNMTTTPGEPDDGADDPKA
jgi:HK97 family phage portal protein